MLTDGKFCFHTAESSFLNIQLRWQREESFGKNFKMFQMWTVYAILSFMHIQVIVIQQHYRLWILKYAYKPTDQKQTYQHFHNE